MPIDQTASRGYTGPEAKAIPPAPQIPQPTRRPAAPAPRVAVATLPPAVEFAEDPPPGPEAPAVSDADAAQAYLETLGGRIVFDRQALVDAFLAGMAHIRAQVPKAPAFEGTIVSRTVVAALQIFLTQILPTAQDEVRSGEWLPAEEVQKMIEEIREVGNLKSVAW